MSRIYHYEIGKKSDAKEREEGTRWAGIGTRNIQMDWGKKNGKSRRYVYNCTLIDKRDDQQNRHAANLA